MLRAIEVPLFILPIFRYFTIHLNPRHGTTQSQKRRPTRQSTQHLQKVPASHHRRTRLPTHRPRRSPTPLPSHLQHLRNKQPHHHHQHPLLQMGNHLRRRQHRRRHHRPPHPPRPTTTPPRQIPASHAPSCNNHWPEKTLQHDRLELDRTHLCRGIYRALTQPQQTQQTSNRPPLPTGKHLRQARTKKRD